MTDDNMSRVMINGRQGRQLVSRDEKWTLLKAVYGDPCMCLIVSIAYLRSNMTHYTAWHVIVRGSTSCV